MKILWQMDTNVYASYFIWHRNAFNLALALGNKGVDTIVGGSGQGDWE